MDISIIRDLVISILFGLISILTIGLMVITIIVYRRVSKLTTSIDNALGPVNRWLTSIQGFTKGLNESVNSIKKGGG